MDSWAELYKFHNVGFVPLSLCLLLSSATQKVVENVRNILSVFNYVFVSFLGWKGQL